MRKYNINLFQNRKDRYIAFTFKMHQRQCLWIFLFAIYKIIEEIKFAGMKTDIFFMNRIEYNIFDCMWEFKFIYE